MNLLNSLQYLNVFRDSKNIEDNLTDKNYLIYTSPVFQLNIPKYFKRLDYGRIFAILLETTIIKWELKRKMKNYRKKLFWLIILILVTFNILMKLH